MSDIKQAIAELKPCIVLGCTKKRKHWSRYCSMHAARLARHGTTDGLTDLDKFMRKVVVAGNGCWEWNGYINDSGYGRYRLKNKKTLAHRAAWLLLRGPIPNDLLVLHHCDNPKCVNPDHLYLGTNGDNMRDCARRGRNWLQRAKQQRIQFCISKGEMPRGYQKLH